MRIKGHGIDIIDLECVAKLVARGDDFIAEWFLIIGATASGQSRL